VPWAFVQRIIDKIVGLSGSRFGFRNVLKSFHLNLTRVVKYISV